MYEKVIESLLSCAETLVAEAKKGNPGFDSSDRIMAGIARAQVGLEKEAKNEDAKELDLRRLKIKKHSLDEDIVVNCKDKAYYMRDDDENDNLTITIAKNVVNEEASVSKKTYVVINKYIDCAFDSSYVVIVDSALEWTKERYDELSKKIERAVGGEEL